MLVLVVSVFLAEKNGSAKCKGAVCSCWGTVFP